MLDISDQDKIDYFKTFLRYEKGEGKLYWKERKKRFPFAGKEAGGLNQDGYRYIRIEGKYYAAYKIIWLLETGKWPKEFLDHSDRNPDNNKFENLRECSHKENCANRSRRNLSGFKGVSSCVNGYRARCEGICLGVYKTKEEAARAYDKRARAVFGEFAHTNFELDLIDE